MYRIDISGRYISECLVRKTGVGRFGGLRAGLAVGLISRYLHITMAERVTRENGSAATKNMVLRLDADLAERLAGIAEVERRSVSDVAREAIAALVEARRKDRRFRRLLEDSMARHQRLLDLLRDEEQ
jgi:hypothetical protein